jgi:hypothetical protein
MPIKVMLHVFVFLLSGFCSCNSSPIPSQTQPRKQNSPVPELSTMDAPELLDLLGSPQSSDEISSRQKNLSGCDVPSNLTVTLRRLLDHVEVARVKASVRSQSCKGFQDVLKSPLRHLTFFQDLSKELRDMLNCFGHRCPLKDIPFVGSTIHSWYLAVHDAVCRLQEVNTVTVRTLTWLQTVSQNLLQQTRAFGNLSKELQSSVCRRSNDSGNVTLHTIITATDNFLRQKARTDARWEKNEKLLIRVSKHIVELDLIFYTDYDIQHTLQLMKTLRSTVFKRLNKHFRLLHNFLYQHTAYSEQLLSILLKNITGYRKLAATEPIFRTFLDNITSVEEQQFHNHMVGLRARLQDLQTALKEMKSSAIDAIDYLGHNTSKHPKAFSLLENISKALKVLLDKGQPMTDGNDVKAKVLRHIQTLGS